MTNTHEFESRFPPIADMLRGIEQLESLQLKDISWDELERLVDDTFGIVVFTKAILPKGARIYRARRNLESGPWTDVRDIHVRESSAITTYGRAHRPYQRVFYGSESFELATFEHLQHLRLQLFPEHEVADLTIGEWIVTEPLHLASITHSSKLHGVREDIRIRHDSINRWLDNSILSKDTVEKQKLMLEFFARQYVKSDIAHNEDYKLSALYAHRIMEANANIHQDYAMERFDGVLYPSVAMRYTGDNVALFWDQAAPKVKFNNAYRVITALFNFHDLTFVPGILHDAKSVDGGTIQWNAEIYKPH